MVSMESLQSQMERPTWDALFAAIMGYEVETRGRRQDLNVGTWYRGDTRVTLVSGSTARPDVVWLDLAGPDYLMKMEGSGPEFVRIARHALCTALA